MKRLKLRISLKGRQKSSENLRESVYKTVLLTMSHLVYRKKSEYMMKKDLGKWKKTKQEKQAKRGYWVPNGQGSRSA